MVNYWAIAPWPNNEPEIFDQVWRYDQDHGTIAIRWHQLGDVSVLPLAQIEERHREIYGYESHQAAQMLWDFYNKVDLGDVVIARKGRSICVGIGRVIRAAYYDPQKGLDRLGRLSHEYRGVNFIDVAWERRGVILIDEMFAIKTLSNIGPEKYRRLFGS
jgi:hypothetical protein